MAKLVVHQLDPNDKTKFKDVTADFGDVSDLSAAGLAKKLHEYGKSKGLDSKLLINEAV